ncbi:hypothetical protein NSS71_08085 [Niallia sp. FSL W8-0951]|uniref:hypothetical protein n=1 Tax=Niallia sp. FSL W8-0951 TaxID=2954639 RepID=UPI0030FADB62
MEFLNKLSFGTPNGLTNGDIERVKNKVLETFDWLSSVYLDIQEIELAKIDGIIDFIFDDTCFDQRVRIIFHKSGVGITVTSNDPNVAIDVFNSLCQLEWGWIEV